MKAEKTLKVRHLSSNLLPAKQFDRIMKDSRCRDLELASKVEQTFEKYEILLVKGDRAAQERLNNNAHHFAARQADGLNIVDNIIPIFWGQPLLVLKHDSDAISLVSDVKVQELVQTNINSALRQPKRPKAEIPLERLDLAWVYASEVSRDYAFSNPIAPLPNLDQSEGSGRGGLWSGSDHEFLAEIIASGETYPKRG